MRARSSLAGLLAFVAIAALASAALALAADLRARPVIALTAVLLFTATLGAVLHRGFLRASCTGFALIGWAYFLAAFRSPGRHLTLPTTRPLIHLHEVVFGSPVTPKPDDVLPLVLRLYEYLRVAHAMTALALGLVGGMVALLLAVGVGVARRRLMRSLATTSRP